MKDTIIKGNGKSRNIKAPADMPETFAAWRAQLLAGSATLDIGLNAEGCDVVGTAISKANLLSDATKTALGLTSNDATVNDALYALFQQGARAEVRVYCDIGSTVTMTRNGQTLSGPVTSTGYAVLHPSELGDWTIVYVFNGSQKTMVYTLKAIAIVNVYPADIGDTLETTSWDNISIASRGGFAATFWKIGDKKSVSLGGETYEAQIIGFDHDTLTTTDGTRTKAGITFQLVNVLNGSYSMNDDVTSEGGWRDSDMRVTTLPTVLNQVPSDLKNVLKSVNKITSVGQESSDLETTSDKLFLLSEVEVFGTVSKSYAGEGTQYAYYSAGNSATKTRTDGTKNGWWERSPSISNSYFCNTSFDGTIGASRSDSTKGIAFAFCV